MSRRNILGCFSILLLVAMVWPDLSTLYEYFTAVDAVKMEYSDPLDSKHQDEKEEEKNEENKDKIRVFVYNAGSIDSRQFTIHNSITGNYFCYPSKVLTPPPDIF